MRDIYRELKEKDYDLYVKTIDKAGALCIRNNLDLIESANLEKTIVEFALTIRSANYA